MSGLPGLSANNPLLAPGSLLNTGQSYVISVSDPALIKKARDYLTTGIGGPYLVPRVKIAAGGDGWNRNYNEPGHPPWDWRATELIEWIDFDPARPRATVISPDLHSLPTQVGSELLSPPHRDRPYESMSLLYFPLVMELSSDRKAAVVNISTRGYAGANERVLIAGFVVQGGEPRNVLIRALGPSLSALGVTEALANPKLSVYRGSAPIATNDDWVTGNFVRPPPVQNVVRPLPLWYSSLFPLDPKESAVRLSLPPGAYTAQVSGVDGTGIALLEVYDFDALAPK
jgi:hypothetical protein